MSFQPKAAKAAKALEENATEETVSILEAFSAATFGSYCRTVSCLEGRHEHWLEAIQIHPGSWNIYSIHVDVTKDGDTLKRGEAERIKAIEEIGMFEALTLLAAHEDAIGPNPKQMVIMDAEELGNDHFIAFGKREGLAFDSISGKPLRTHNGHVIDAAVIDYDTMIEIRRAWEEKQMVFLTDQNTLRPNFNVDVEMEQLKRLFVSIEDCLKVNRLRDAFDTAVQHFENVVESDAEPKAVGQFYSSISKIKEMVSEEFSDAQDVHHRLQQYVIALELYMGLFEAKMAFAKFYHDGAEAQRIQKDVLDRAGKIKNQYLSLGGEPVKIEHIMADIVAMSHKTQFKKTNIPDAVYTVRRNIRQMAQETDKIKTDLRVAALGRKEREQLFKNPAKAGDSGARLAASLAQRKL